MAEASLKNILIYGETGVGKSYLLNVISSG